MQYLKSNLVILWWLVVQVEVVSCLPELSSHFTIIKNINHQGTPKSSTAYFGMFSFGVIANLRYSQFMIWIIIVLTYRVQSEAQV